MWMIDGIWFVISGPTFIYFPKQLCINNRKSNSINICIDNALLILWVLSLSKCLAWTRNTTGTCIERLTPRVTEPQKRHDLQISESRSWTLHVWSSHFEIFRWIWLALRSITRFYFIIKQLINLIWYSLANSFLSRVLTDFCSLTKTLISKQLVPGFNIWVINDLCGKKNSMATRRLCYHKCWKVRSHNTKKIFGKLGWLLSLRPESLFLFSL